MAKGRGFYRKLSSGAAVLAALMALAPMNAQAHRPWLKASATQVEGKEPYVTFDVAISEGLFEFDHRPGSVEGLTILGPDGSAVTAENIFAGKLRTSFDLKLAKEGTYKVSIVTDTVMGSYKLNGETKRFRGTAEAFAKESAAGTDAQSAHMYNRLETFTTVGRGNDTVFKTTGKGLELVPLTHPSDLVVDEPATFRLLMNGQPAKDLSVNVVPGGARFRNALKEQAIKTNEKGEFTVTWSIAEEYWVSASYPPRRAPQPQAQGAQGPAPQTGGPQGQGGPGGPGMGGGMPLEDRFSYTGTFTVMPN